MGAQKLRPETLEESLIYWSIVGTWGFWLLGLLYVVGSAMSYVLLLVVALRAFDAPARDEPTLKPPALPALVWMAGMMVMLLALVVAHIDLELGTAQTIKSSIGWAKGWAIMGIMPLVGSMLVVRPAIIGRALGILALHTLLLAPFFFLANKVHLPGDLYVSPLYRIFGVSPQFFDVTLYTYDEVTGNARWRFYGPWSTAVAFYAGIGLVLSIRDRSSNIKVVSILSTIVVCYMAGSRLSLVAVPAILLAIPFMSNLLRPAVWLAAAVVATIGILFWQDAFMAYQDATDAFNAARAASSRVRAALGNIAYHRWETGEFLFGNGVLQRGGHVVETMMIGSHHTWWGLLFVKGLVGFVALAVPMAVSFFDLLLKSQTSRVARAALAVLLSLLFFSLADNLEIVAYLIWPGLLYLGIAHGQRLHNPLAPRLGAARHYANAAGLQARPAH
ncbi:MAG: hypothetical protein R3D68_05790 [Hyphomicrobiaceae bacterium]